VQVPHTLLSPAALRAIVEEFVTRDGTDHSPVEPRIQAVLAQLADGRAELHFHRDTASCQVVVVKG
jgi:uncharacterized protein